jgi:hypothetical protein
VDNRGKDGSPSREEAREDLRWKSQIPLDTSLTYKCVKVLDYKQETLDKKPVETVVLPYVGFDSGIPLDVRRISFEISGMY